MIFYTSINSFFHDLACNKLEHELIEQGSIVLFCEYPPDIVKSNDIDKLIELFGHSVRDLPFCIIEEIIQNKKFQNTIKLLSKECAILYGSTPKFKLFSFSNLKEYNLTDWDEIEEFILSKYGFFVTFDRTLSPSVSLTSQLTANEDCFFEVR